MEVPGVEYTTGEFSVKEGRWWSNPNINNNHIRINLDFEYKEVIGMCNLDRELIQEMPFHIMNSVSIIHPQVIDSEITQETIKRELRLWNITEDFLEDKVKEIIDTTSDMLKSSVSRGNNNVLEVYVKYSQRRDHYEDIQEGDLESEGEEDSGYFEDILQEESEYSEGEDSSSNVMVPAMESSIKSLKRKRITTDCENNGTCPICFEDLISSGDYEEEAVCMPCSHEFHADCITEWLRISHYCPMCRYEMPTEKLPKYQ